MSIVRLSILKFIVGRVTIIFNMGVLIIIKNILDPGDLIFIIINIC